MDAHSVGSQITAQTFHYQGLCLRNNADTG